MVSTEHESHQKDQRRHSFFFYFIFFIQHISWPIFSRSCVTQLSCKYFLWLEKEVQLPFRKGEGLPYRFKKVRQNMAKEQTIPFWQFGNI